MHLLEEALGGNGICPICHRDNPTHDLKDCALLKSLHLKLIHVAPVASPPAPAPASSAPAGATPSPGGRVATALGGSTGSATAPSGLMACTLNVLEEFDLDDDFRWDGNEYGMEYGAS
jgi:hypothetical protein